MNSDKHHKVKIKLASQDEVSQLELYVSKVLKALGHPEALVTDESYVSDFLCVSDEEEASLELAKACLKLGISFNKKDSVVAVARRLKDGKIDILHGE